ncbi:MAG: hypothetical protein ABJM82_16205 [Shimia thalassica]|uniref:hypothetical protein n=1 Tax=Shimia thalassica TaxID=1715693 RepID=UPI003296AA6D
MIWILLLSGIIWLLTGSFLLASTVFAALFPLWFFYQIFSSILDALVGLKSDKR